MKLLFGLIFSIFFSIAFTQDVVVASTEEYTNQLQNAYWTRVLGQDESGYYLLREFGPVSNTTIVLEKYSPSLKMLFATNIESTSGTITDSRLHRYTEMKNGKIYVFLEGWSKAKQQNSFLVKQVNDDGSLSENVIVLETEPSSGQLKSANYSISFSPDGSKLLVLTQKPFEKGGKETLRLQVFNTGDFSSVWKQDLTLENEAERYPLNEIVINNSGIAYLFKDIKISNKEHIYKLITTGKDFSDVVIVDMKSYAPGQKKFMVDHAGKLLICGTLVPPGARDTDWQGIWYFQADESGKVIQNKTEALGAQMLSLLVSQKNAEKEGYVIENFVLKDVLQKPSGGIIMLTEEQRQSKAPVGQATPPVYEYSLFYGDILAISLDSDGNRNWNSVIEKKQSEKTLDPKVRFGSYAYQLKNEKLYVVWNYMNIFSDPPLNKFRYWIDKNGSKINIDNTFGKEAYYPTLLTVIDKTGNFEYKERTFNSLPLENIQKPNAFPMATDPSIFFTTEKGMVILSHMNGIEAKRYKFNTINY